MLHAKDPALYTVISEEEWVLTNNEADFRALTERGGLHSGLILLPQRTRADQTLMLEVVLVGFFFAVAGGILVGSAVIWPVCANDPASGRRYQTESNPRMPCC